MKQTLSFFVCLRVIAILAIIAHHSFCAFSGWPPNSELMSELPKWSSNVSCLLKTIGLDLFTFLAGWFAVGSISGAKSAALFVWGKVKRILVPCVFAALVYQFLYPQYMYRSFPAAINGTHLWYLPMIFELLILAYGCIFICDKLHFWDKWGGGVMRVSAVIFALVILTSIARIIPLRTMVEAKRFWPIFALGMMGAWYKDVYESFAVIFKLPKIIQTVNKHSFGLYITHQFVINFFIARLSLVNKYPLLTVGLMFVLTAITSLAICIAYEQSKNCVLRKVCGHE